MKRVTINVDGRAYDVELTMSRDGGQTATIGEQAFHVSGLTRDATGHRRVQVTFDGAAPIDVERLDLAHVRVDDVVSSFRIDAVSSGAGGAGVGPDGAMIRPPMPGKIVSLKVAVGDTVAAGDTLLVLEAMKMQNEVISPAAGLVTAIRVTVGDAVDTPDVLIVLGPRDETNPDAPPKEVHA